MYDVVGRQVLPMAKHPELITMPLPKVDVPLPTVRLLATLRLVVVALVPVALAKVRVVKLARVANSSVEVARVNTLCSAVSMLAFRFDVVAEEFGYVFC